MGYSFALCSEYKAAEYQDLGTLAFKATDRPSERGFASSGARPSAITNLLLSKWTDQENIRCIQLLSKSQAFKDAQESMKLERRGIWASTERPTHQQPDSPACESSRPSARGSNRSSRPQSARPSTKSHRSNHSLSQAATARLPRPQSASVRSEDSSSSFTARSRASNTVRTPSARVFAYDRTFVDPTYELRKSVKLKDKSRRRRYGMVRPSSATIGSQVSSRPPVRPELGKRHEMRSFLTITALN